MSDVTIITAPDIIANDCYSILLLCPSQNLRTDLQDILRRIDIPVNVYLYSGVEEEPAWFLRLCKMVDISIVDIDNLDLSEPLKLKAFQYDIVCNGIELSSGAIHKS